MGVAEQTAGASVLEADMTDAGKPGDTAGDDSSHPGATTARIGNPPQLDILQRIAAALGRTGEPKLRDGPHLPMFPGMTLVGEVPPHLRHVHNLLDELTDEEAEISRSLAKKRKEIGHVRDLFFASLPQHVAAPKNTTSMAINKDWTVSGMVPDESDEFGDDRESDLESMFGGRDDPFGPQVLDLGKMFDGDDDPIAGLLRGISRGARRRRMRTED